MSAPLRQILADAPAGYWPGDEGAGSLVDRSGNGRTMGVRVGAPTYRNAGPGFYAIGGRAATDDRFSTAYTTSQSKYALECWFSLSAAAQHDRAPLGMWGGTTGTGAMLYIDTGVMKVFHGGTLYAPDATVLPVGVGWHHAAVWDGATLTYIRNGVVVGAPLAIVSAPGTSDEPLQILGYGGIAADRSPEGIGAHFAVWGGTVPTVARMQAHAAAIARAGVSI